MRCGVIGSVPEHQTEWFDETMKVMAERYHELTPKQVADLRVLGERFAAPTARPAAAATPGVTTDEATTQKEVGSDDSEAVAVEGELNAANAA